LIAVRALRARVVPFAVAVATAVSLAATGGAAPPAAPAAVRSAGCGAAVAQVGNAALAVVSRGVRRSAMVYVPPGASAHPAALLVAFHGTGGSGRFMERYSGLLAQLDRSGAIGVFPDADGDRWNVEESAHDPDDVDFARDLIDSVGRRYCVDERRVSAVGVSNGGSMAALLACTIPQRLAGVAIVAGGFATLPPCRSRRPVSVLEIHGTDDPIAPYSGAVPWVRGWASRDGCRSVPRKRVVAQRTVRYDWVGCRGGTTVAHLEIWGGRHQWPGATPPDPGPAATISAAAQAWGFLVGKRSA
jgi:polyhydroxybutyrate depolymerase